MATLTVQPLLPPLIWLTLLVASAALLGVYAWRRPAGVGWRKWLTIIAMMATSAALVFGLLLNIQWVVPVASPEGKPSLTILLDVSSSMGTADAGEGNTRIAAAIKQAKDALPALAKDFDVQLATFSESAKPVTEFTDAPADGSLTDLAAGLRLNLTQYRPRGQAIWLLSDGIPTVSGGLLALDEVIRTARTMDVPIYTTTLGSQQSSVDISVDLRHSQDIAFINQPAQIIANIRNHDLVGRQVNVSLRSGEKELERQTVKLQEGSPATARFEVSQKQVGVFMYQISVENAPGETVISNNSSLFVLKVVDKPIRVLVLEGKPYWDSKFLLHTLRGVPAIRVESIIRLKDDRFIVRGTGESSASSGSQPAATEWEITTKAPAILAEPKRLDQCQVLVLGRDAEAFLSPEALANVQRWIAREGGCLVCSRGAPSSIIDERLGKLLPVSWTASTETHYSPRLTDAGRQLQWVPFSRSGELPLLATRNRQITSKPLAVVVASTDEQTDSSAAFVYQPYGAGRVVVIEGSGMWRWAFLPPQRRTAESTYEMLWQGTLRWLVSGGGLQPGQQRLLRADSTVFRKREPATATLLTRPELAGNAQPPVELSDASGKLLGRFTPAALGDEIGVYRVDFGTLAEGEYRARLSGGDAGDMALQIAFEVRDLGEERLDLKSRPDLMARVAHETGGRPLARNGAELTASFQGHQTESRPTRLERTTVWDRWWVLATALGVWAACWGLRRNWGLI